MIKVGFVKPRKFSRTVRISFAKTKWHLRLLWASSKQTKKLWMTTVRKLTLIARP